jgi:hypothetical protein
MREVTQQMDHLKAVSEVLTHVTGVPFLEALETLRWVQAYVRRCVEEGLADDFQIAMERSGLGELAESLLEVARRNE